MDMNKSGKFLNLPNKVWEIQFTKWDYEDASNNYGIHCEYSTKCDHAGFRFRIDFWQFMFEFQIYDTRHWPYSSLPVTEQNYDIPECKTPKQED
jgi:hypothetical protein